MELKQYFNTIRKWWWLIAASTLVAMISSFIAVQQQPSLYRAKTTLMVGRSLADPNPTGNDVWLGQQLAQTYAEIAKRQPVQEATKQALGLTWLPQYNVSLVPNTQLIEISVVDTVPERAQAVANELAQQLIEQSPSAPERQQQERRDFVNRQLQEIEKAIDDTNARIQDLKQQLANMFSARQIADTQNQIAALEQKLNTYQANYAQLLTFLEGGINTLSVVEPAALPTTPVGPNRGMTVLLAAAIGFLLALGAAFLMDYLDDTLKNPDDIKAAMEASTLGAITVIEGETPDQKLVTALHPKSPTAEAYRILRTNIQFSALDNPPRTLMATSPNPGEGKSTTLANLGVVMAQQGQRVILVDTDLRRPTLHRFFGLPNSVGLTTALLQGTSVADGFLQPTRIENLSVLTSGPLPPNPAELIGSERFAALLEDLKQQADVVLLDSPPALAVTDAAILARQVDGVLMVVEAGGTRRPLAVNAKDALEKVGAKVLGVVLNRLQPRGDGYYYYYYYYYHQYYAHDDEGKGENDSQRRRRKQKPEGWRRLLPGGLGSGR
ncbi:MAG: polysaccharide biosynthesis tyrosine autokinase [Caldilineales bacterium]|nr:polysaccharide biosynthesis tyrosine autokinase [Caldilineales bacterium]